MMNYKKTQSLRGWRQATQAQVACKLAVVIPQLVGQFKKRPVAWRARSPKVRDGVAHLRVGHIRWRFIRRQTSP
jgi:hypothetical protein